MPTMNLREDDVDYAVAAMVPVDAEGITYVYGRQASDTRAMEPGDIDQGNARFGGQEVLVHFDDVFVPYEHVLMDGEYEFAQSLVTRFTSYHRASYVCKTGLGDVMVGAAAQVADDNGVPNATHIKDKLVEMTHLNETIYSSSVASAHEAQQLDSGIWINDDMLSNVCKHNVTRFPYEIARLAQDLAGGIVVTMPSEADFRNDEVGPLIEKLLEGRADVPTENRMRILRLIENLTLGRNAVGYLTESLHGAGSPQAQRIQILRGMDVETKKAYARTLAGIRSGDGTTRPRPPRRPDPPRTGAPVSSAAARGASTRPGRGGAPDVRFPPRPGVAFPGHPPDLLRTLACVAPPAGPTTTGSSTPGRPTTAAPCVAAASAAPAGRGSPPSSGWRPRGSWCASARGR